MKLLLLLCAYIPIALAESASYYNPDEGTWTVVENAKQVDVVIDKNNQGSLLITPGDEGQTFVYGDELIIMESTPFGIISY